VGGGSNGAYPDTSNIVTSVSLNATALVFAFRAAGLTDTRIAIRDRTATVSALWTASYISIPCVVDSYAFIALAATAVRPVDLGTRLGASWTRSPISCKQAVSRKASKGMRALKMRRDWCRQLYRSVCVFLRLFNVFLQCLRPRRRVAKIPVMQEELLALVAAHLPHADRLLPS
jgi:hypothetical protein